MKHSQKLSLTIFLSCVSFIAAAADYSGAKSNVLSNAASEFCEKYRADLLAQKANWKVASSDSNGLVVVPFPGNPKREAQITMDAESGQIIGFSTLKGFSQKRYGPTVSNVEQQVSNKKNALLADFCGNNAEIRQVQARTFSFAERGGHEVIEYAWKRQTNGFAYRDDFIRFLFDAKDGELLSFRKSWGTAPRSTKLNVELEAAKTVVAKRIGAGDNPKALRVQSAELAVVTPNDLFGRVRQTSERRLAWVVVVPTQFQQERPAEFWIDSETGALLGGTSLQ